MSGWLALPTPLRGACRIGAVDQECQARVVTRFGRPFGAWVDDTTFNAQHDLAYYVNLTRQKYEPLGLTVFVCVPPGEPHRRWPEPIVSVYEAYIYGMGVPPADWLPLPRFSAYCVQKRWPGTHGSRPPTVEQFDRLLGLVRAQHPRFIWVF